MQGFIATVFKKKLEIRDGVLAVAHLGGYQGKGSEKPPGFESVKRGLICLGYMVWGYQMGRRDSPAKDSNRSSNRLIWASG